MRILPVLLAVLILAAPLSSLAAGQNNTADVPAQGKAYDYSGRYQGKTVSDGQGQAKVYDKSGRYQGKTVRQGKTIKVYDKSGRYIGRLNTR